MPKIRSGRPAAGLWWGWGMLVAASAVVVGSGCGERDRLTFAPPNDGVGPVTTIGQPNGPDTTVFSGGEFVVSGQTIDPDGVDTVYFLVIAGNQGFGPVHPDPARTTVNFDLRLTTLGHADETFLVEVYGVDVRGNRGDASTRQIHIR